MPALEALLDREIPSPAGPLRLREETAADAPFRFALFCEARPELALLPLDPAMKERLLRQQFQAQNAGYAAQHPGAANLIVECSGAAVARLVLAQPGGALHIADIAVAASRRGGGMGAAVLSAVHDWARAMDMPVRLHVSRNNPAALRLYVRLGFVAVAEGAADIELEWK